MTQWRRPISCAALALLLSGVAMAPVSAQTPDAPPTPPRQPQDQPEVIQPPQEAPAGSLPGSRPRENLGQAPSGVIHPPDTGTRDVITPPTTREPMPDVRPPGAPGTNPNVEPR
jgi:hypothetical protein